MHLYNEDMEHVTLERNETILGVVRGRFLFALPRLFFGLLWMFTPFFFFFPLMSLGFFGWCAFVVLFGTGMYYALKRFVIWKKTQLIITDRRVIDVDRLSLRKQRVTELLYPDVVAVHMLFPHVLARIFHTATVVLESRGHVGFDLVATHVHKPNRMRDLVLEVQCLVNKPHTHDDNERAR